MRAPTISNTQQVSSSVINLTGGINESDIFSQMRAGELFRCRNYEGVDGTHVGYKPIAGFEVFDGKPSPSSIPVISSVDKGAEDELTELVLSAGIGIKDASRRHHTITNNGVEVTTARSKFDGKSFLFDSTTLGVSSITDWDINRSFCLDFWVNLNTPFGTYTLFEKGGSFKVSLNDSAVEFSVSFDGIGYNVVLTGATLSQNVWQHFAISRNNGTITLYQGGLNQAEYEASSPISTNPSAIFTIGDTNGLSCYLQMIRFSAGTPRFVDNFSPPNRAYTNDGYYREYNSDTEREAARFDIEEVPGVGQLSGGFVFNGTVCAVRNISTISPYASMYRASPSGWGELLQPVGFELEKDGVLRSLEYKFDGFNNNEPILLIVDGVSSPRYFDGTEIFHISHENLPVAIQPHLVGAYDNRIILAYEGSLFFSVVGDPTDFGALGNAGEIKIGGRITNIVNAPGNTLVVTTEKETKLIKSLEYSVDSWVFKVETFSSTLGAYTDTAQNFLGDTYLASDEGVISLKVIDLYGDFQAASLSKKANKTYQANRSNIIGSLVDHTKSQYKLFFSTGIALSFSFNYEKFVKEITILDYGIPIEGIFQGKDQSGNWVRYFTSTNGYLYQFDIGTSFNGSAIPTAFETAFHGFKTPTTWKRFRKLTVDALADLGTYFHIRPRYTYGDTELPAGSSIEQYQDMIGGSEWGAGEWSQFRYGGLPVRTSALYLSGYGTVLSTSFKTSEKYKKPHTIQNFIVDFTTGTRRV